MRHNDSISRKCVTNISKVAIGIMIVSYIQSIPEGTPFSTVVLTLGVLAICGGIILTVLEELIYLG